MKLIDLLIETSDHRAELDQLTVDLKRGMSTRDPNPVRIFITDALRAKLNHLEIKAVLESMKPEILEWLRSFISVRKKYLSNVAAHFVLNIKYLQKSAGINWNELDAIVEDNKFDIVKYLLTLFKTEHYKFALELIKDIHTLGFDWDELYTIKNSIDSIVSGKIDHHRQTH